ncbi:3'-5' exonuclease [Streptosporangium sp. NPDC005286]|uniref:3'-5' exonuclease n=1 Tax=Streptosporangium sp. NPDC005286 TaxID=3154463 RepID=UPI0033A94453
MHDQPWHELPLTALGVKISGGVSPAIVDVAVVPLLEGRPHMGGAYHSIVNPHRSVAPRPSIPPGLENDILALGPPLPYIRAKLTARLTGRAIICHDVNQTWRLLAQYCPDVQPVVCFDTLHLTQIVRPDVQRRSLTALLRWHELAEQTSSLAAEVPAQRALWDAVGVGLLLPVLIRAWESRVSELAPEGLSLLTT